MEKSYNIARPYRDIYQTRLLKQAAIYQQPIFYGLPTTDSNEEGKIKMDQRKIRKALKIAKIEDNDFSYQDIADLLQIKVGSVYNWLANSYQFSQQKARYLSAWLAEKGFLE